MLPNRIMYIFDCNGINKQNPKKLMTQTGLQYFSVCRNLNGINPADLE